ncbi:MULTISPECIES: fructosamine kinase family protein [Pseudonocardia]|uniref:Fructosamine kinase n=2 Tax=Pseudonocardia TaxID=1847 RepID=A0A1Y2MZ47_PSEAH|nr:MULTISPECIES: fructosamine kinase family protein [Pseudonocardia]OSY40450.1 Fructosamine kinase [Pseudonocardia autotrophica]TDN72221.1 fructosamine-3-kinase [Pseudonocardia autotrophica]BBG02930.1 fructosamine kinase [Pseudonocardia autotrophica]GEC25168.1 fructosamine kinase [Pseudonocardia saturnea]
MSAPVQRLTGRTVAAELGGHPPRFRLGDGAEAVTVVVKSGAADPGAIPAEAAGLRWLAVPGGPPVPEVLGADDEWLSSTWIPPGRPTADAAGELGRRLTVLHAAGAQAFGAPPPGGPASAWIGHAGMRNVPHDGPWGEWFVQDRVLPYLRIARDRGDLDPVGAAAIDRVCERIDRLVGPDEPPARLHGDLWSGNVLWSGGAAWLIDPAAHGGHRESDLAMLDLFGLPHLEQVLAGYAEAAADAGTPLAEGWRERVPLHQLFPLLVHTVLFGGGYAGQAVAAARRLT